MIRREGSLGKLITQFIGSSTLTKCCGAEKRKTQKKKKKKKETLTYNNEIARFFGMVGP